MSRKAKRLQKAARSRVETDYLDVQFAAGGLDIEAASGEGGAPKIELKAYTGGKLSLGNFPHPVVINTATVKAMDADQLPVLRDHDQSRVIGHGKPVIADGSLAMSGTLSVPGEDRDDVVQASKNEFRWQSSVGGRIPEPRKNTRTIRAGKTVKVNNRTFEGPVTVVNAFFWKETSVVALGADEGRASAAIAAQGNRSIPMGEFEKWLEASGVDSDSLSEDGLASLRAAWEAQQNATSTESVDVAGIIKAATESATQAAIAAAGAAQQQVNKIDRLFASYSDVDMSAEDRDKLRADVEGGKVTLDAAHVQLLQAKRQGNTSNVAIHSNGSNATPMELEASLGRQAGFSEEDIHASLVEHGASEEQAERAVSRSNGRPQGLKAMISMVCMQEGHYFAEVGDDAIRCAINIARQQHQRELVQASSGFSSVSLPGILSRMANKAMLAAYAEADNGGVALQICSTTSTRDFKKFNRYRMTESGVMEKVSAAGEIKHGNLKEEEYENQVETYGKIIALTRQMIRNDDLDAFLQVPRMIGRMGRHSLEQATIDTLVDAPTNSGAGTTEFFHGAPRGNDQPNYLVGANTNLSIDALGPAYTLFLNQTDSDGKPIMIDPSLLLCTNYDIIAARKLFTDTQYRFTSADRTETINNQWEGMFTPVKSSYLHLRGASPSQVAWYLLSRPTIDVSGMQIAFLDGQQTPIIQQSETSFDTLGLQMRGYFDFGVALQDPRAIVKVKGEA